MTRTALPLAAFFAVAAAGCNCGKQPVITKTEASLALGSDLVDFGVVPEGTSKGGKFRVDNVGRAPVNLDISLAANSSADFTLGSIPVSIEAGGFVEVPVVFAPMGKGEDEGFVDVRAAGTSENALRVRLHGGPIVPALAFDPDPLDFKPSMMSLERKTAQLKSVGTAALTVNSVGVAANGNPDFSVVAPTLPVRLLPGESTRVTVEYARSVRTTEGLMEVLSDDADAGLQRLRLLPDPPAACSDLADNDMDGLADYPNDPGCQDPSDTDEYNPAMCVSGASQPCGAADGGYCAGTRYCTNGLWGMCMDAGSSITETCNNRDDDCDGQVDDGVTRGCYPFAANTRGIGNCRDGMEACNLGNWTGNCAGAVGPSTEVCGNMVDENCNGMLDDGCATDAGCNPNGTFTLDAGVISYACCDFGLGATVNIDISQFQIQSSATVLRPTPSQPGSTLTSTTAATCPSGNFSYTRTLSGQCNETYTLTGSFVGPNTFVGTYTATFSGSQCAGGLCAGDPCTNQSWNISAGR